MMERQIEISAFRRRSRPQIYTDETQIVYRRTRICPRNTRKPWSNRTTDLKLAPFPIDSCAPAHLDLSVCPSMSLASQRLPFARRYPSRLYLLCRCSQQLRSWMTPIEFLSARTCPHVLRCASIVSLGRRPRTGSQKGASAESAIHVPNLESKGPRSD